MPCRGLPEATSTTIVMLLRPVKTTCADTSTRSPICTGRWKSILPTYAVTQYRPDQPAAHANPALSIHSRIRPPLTVPPCPASVGAAMNRRVICPVLAVDGIPPA